MINPPRDSLKDTMSAKVESTRHINFTMYYGYNNILNEKCNKVRIRYRS